MVNLRICKFLWIIIVVIFVLVELVDCKKHRALHSQLHQRRHHPHQQRKPHDKIHHHQHHHFPLIKKFPRSITTNNSNLSSNMTKFHPSTNSLVNESTLLPAKRYFPTNEDIRTVFSTMWNTSTCMNLNNTNFHPHETLNISSKQDFKSIDFSPIGNATTAPSVDSSSSQFDKTPNILSTTTKFRHSTTFPLSSTISSTLESIVDPRETIENLVSLENRTFDDNSENTTFKRTSESTNITHELVESEKLNSTKVKEYKMLPTERNKEIAIEFRSVTNIPTLKNADNLEIVTDVLISSTKSNPTTYNRQKFVKELEELFGPTEEPKDLTNVDTPQVVLIRKKRSNEEREEAEQDPKKRTLRDFNGPDTSDESENFEDFSNVVHKRVKRNDPKDFDENPYALNPNYLQDLEDSFAPSALEVQAQKSDDEMTRKSKLSQDNAEFFNNKLRFKRDTNNANYEGNSVNDSSIEIKQNSENNEQQMEQKNVLTDSSKSTPEKLSQSDGFTSKKDFSETDSLRITSSSLDQSASSTVKNEEERRNREDKELLNKRKSAPEIVNLQDDNSLLKNGLDDVYPDPIEDSQPESMVPLVRTKRFGGGFVYPESSDLSYANEQPDSSKTALDEPYVEDNKVIDSMLNKVDDRIAEEGRDNEYNKLKNEIDEKSEVSSRDKRDTEHSTRLKRRFGYHGKGKRKKNRRRKKKKKKHRHRTQDYKKRAPLLSDREYRKEVAQAEKDSSKDDEDHFHEIYYQDVISPHDGRRRRDYENEANDNLHYNINEPALGQVQRKLRASEDDQKNLSDDNIRRNAVERDKIVEDNANREKRGIRRDEDANGTSQISDKNSIGPKIAEPIKDIKELVEKLLVKVNELHGYANDGTGDTASTKNSRNARTTSKTIILQTSEAPKIIPESNVGEKSMSKPVNSMRRRKSCWRASTSDRHPPKRHRSSKSIAGGCERRIRRKRKPGRKWDRWTDWSGCSVTCGKGRQIRWRHCLRNCSTAETEMEEKACQFPACAPGKFLGIFG